MVLLFSTEFSEPGLKNRFDKHNEKVQSSKNNAGLKKKLNYNGGA